jgi:hypothetical protein
MSLAKSDTAFKVCKAEIDLLSSNDGWTSLPERPSIAILLFGRYSLA